MKIEELDQKEDWKKQFIAYALNPVGFLLIAGKNGTGKTTVAESILENATMKYRHPQEPLCDEKLLYHQATLFMKWTEERMRWGQTTYLCERLNTVKLLVLDDFGTREPPPSFKDFLYTVIEHREREKENIGTILTTNLNAIEIREKFGDAIVSRIASGKVFRFEGEDRRFKEF